MTRHRVLIADPLGTAGIELLQSHDDVEVVDAPGLEPAELHEVIADVDAVIIRSGTRLDAAAIDAAQRLRIIGRAGVGVDNIDLDAATRRGIVVTNTPGANTTATAEHTIGLMLAAMRHIAHAHASLAAGEWRRPAFVGTQLSGRVLGIVGLGRVGREVTQRARAFGMKIVASDPFVSEIQARDIGVELVELDKLLEIADVVSLHASSPSDAGPLIDEEAVKRLRPTAVLVNVARGHLIDPLAVRRALDNDELGAVAIDVYETEPPAADHPLVGHPRVVHTPHLGASTVEAQRDVSLQIVEQVVAGLRGQQFLHAVNVPFTLDETATAHIKLAEALGRIQATLAPSAITGVEVEAVNHPSDVVKSVASGVLAGLLSGDVDDVNIVNAPYLADKRGLRLIEGQRLTGFDYPNLVSCRVEWEGGSRTVSGVVFGGHEPRLVQIDDFHLDARPEGVVLLMSSIDSPGVIGMIGTILGSAGVNIAEWRLGRLEVGGRVLSFINLDNSPPPATLEHILNVEAVHEVATIEL